MRVLLVRHGEAASSSPDGERPLTAKGRDDARRLAEWCAANGHEPHVIRHSGILRAAQTAEILGARLSPPQGVVAARGLAPDDEPQPWADELSHEPGTIVVVTHMPLVGRLAALLTARRSTASFAPAECWCLERDGERFRVVSSWTPDATPSA
jgi:phosphohistidine phosphatase